MSTDALLLAQAATEAKLVRDTVRGLGLRAQAHVTLKDRTELHGQIAYWGLIAFGLRQGESVRAVRYLDVERVT